MLVEDNQLNREMFSRRLERKGFRVVSAGDGLEAVNKAQVELPDLILMDLTLPVMDGWEATRKLKSNRATQAIPVIALTAHAMVGDREKAVAAGCNDYETKPVDLPRLLDKIRSLLGISHSGDDGPPSKSSKQGIGLRPAATPPVMPIPRTPLPVPGNAGLSILVVDDNQLNRDVLSRRLEREGYRVSLAHDGRQALDLFGRQSFDLVLLDMMMPEMNGIEVLRVIRASRSLIELPVIIVTAKDQAEDMVEALEVGANDYVVKPFNFPVLLARLQTQFQVRRSHQASAAPRQGQGSTTARREVEDLSSTRTPIPSRGLAELAGVVRRPDVRQSSTATLESPSDSGSYPGDRPLSRVARGPERGFESRPPSWSSDSAPGDNLAGYEVLEELGRGGMGVVFKARHVKMNRLVALKVISKEHLFRPSTVQRFYSEIQAAAQLSHPNIVMAFDAGQFGDSHYFAMEYVEGVDLSRLVKEHGPLPIKHACSFIVQAAKGLQHAGERGLVHRDVKPSNLLVTGGSGPGLPPLDRATVKILDLGLALLYEPNEAGEGASGLTRDGRVVGTADYMAPEQWMNAHKVDIRADLYALGGTFYYLLSGQVPFPGAEPMEKMLKHHLDEPVPVERLRLGIPPVVVSVVRRLMAKKPEQRYQQPADVVDALKVIQSGG